MTSDSVTAEDTQFLRSLKARLVEPDSGLPTPVFEFALAIVPMINVDLVVIDNASVLWAWREDRFGRGWHIPGGIIRLNEPIAKRIMATARKEVGGEVDAEEAPRAIIQFFGARGTFISLAFRCRIRSTAVTIGVDTVPRPGDLRWINGIPATLYPAHLCYRQILPIMFAKKAGAPIMLSVGLTDEPAR